MQPSGYADRWIANDTNGLSNLVAAAMAGGSSICPSFYLKILVRISKTPTKAAAAARLTTPGWLQKNMGPIFEASYAPNEPLIV
jgi:hypothetical protein